MSAPATLEVALIGLGAIGRAIFERMQGHARVRITQVVASARSLDAARQWLAGRAEVGTELPASCTLALECAGHAALRQHVLPALARGTECAVLSVGALSEPGLPEALAEAAERGGTQVHLLSGAIGGIDAIAAAKLGGLESVTYIGRKPPAGWRGSPAEHQLDLDALTAPTAFLEASAREAARLYPKNANVAATVSLAGLGLDATRVRLVADPGIRNNIHEVELRGAFGEMRIAMRGKPLPDNPRTSALTVLSALRFLHNRAAPLSL